MNGCPPAEADEVFDQAGVVQRLAAASSGDGITECAWLFLSAVPRGKRFLPKISRDCQRLSTGIPASDRVSTEPDGGMLRGTFGSALFSGRRIPQRKRQE